MTDTTAATAESPPRRNRQNGSPHGESRARPVSLRDVAKEAKVSVATVSMVLNENPRISRATHLRISRIIEKMGYQPNRLAQSLSSRYTHVLAIMLPALRHAFADAYFGELISGICDRTGKLGFKIMLEQAKPEFIKERKHIQIFERRYVDGLLVLGMNDRHHFLEEFQDGRYPLCAVDNKFTQWKLDHCVCDYKGGAEQVMNYLLQLGHRNIACIYAAPEIQTAADVLNTYRQRLHEAGHSADDSWTEDGKFTDEGGAAAAANLLKRHPEITALFCGNDKMAIGALHYLSSQGIKVPEQVSVVGFDNMQHAAFVTPSLTTVHLPLYQVGALAAERLIDRIRGRTERVTETLPTHLVVRNSTAMARNGPEKLSIS